MYEDQVYAILRVISRDERLIKRFPRWRYDRSYGPRSTFIAESNDGVEFAVSIDHLEDVLSQVRLQTECMAPGCEGIAERPIKEAYPVKFDSHEGFDPTCRAFSLCKAHEYPFRTERGALFLEAERRGILTRAKVEQPKSPEVVQAPVSRAPRCDFCGEGDSRWDALVDSRHPTMRLHESCAGLLGRRRQVALAETLAEARVGQTHEAAWLKHVEQDRRSAVWTEIDEQLRGVRRIDVALVIGDTDVSATPNWPSQVSSATWED